MNAISEAVLIRLGGFPGRTSTLSCEAEDDISISFQPLPLDEGNSSGAVRRRWADLLSSSVARSARIEWAMRSLKDTARSRAIASLRPAREVPPNSKK